MRWIAFLVLAGCALDVAGSSVAQRECTQMTAQLGASTLIVHDDGARLFVHVDPAPDVTLEAVDLDIGAKAYSRVVERASFGLAIPLSEIGARCGDAIPIAVRAHTSGAMAEREVDYALCCPFAPDAGQGTTTR